MDLERIKLVYFFMSGIYSILMWNLLLNANDYFVLSLEDPDISQ